MSRVALKGLLFRRSRTILTALAIVLGVAILIASPNLIYLGVGTGRKEAVDSSESVPSGNVKFSARDA